MATPPIQDGPPPGGFPAVRFKRGILRKGPSGPVFAVGALLTMGYGWKLVIDGNRERRAFQLEKQEARRAIMPLLQAEEDARYVAARSKQIEAEKKIMKNVPGWKAGESVYNSGRWMPAAVHERNV